MGHIDSSAWIAPSAVVTGEITIGAESRVLHGAVLNGDLGPQEPLDFPGTVYGVPRGTPMREIMRRQCAAFAPSGDLDRP